VNGSIAAIVLLGFGPAASVGLVVTLGYGVGETQVGGTVTATHSTAPRVTGAHATAARVGGTHATSARVSGTHTTGG